MTTTSRPANGIGGFSDADWALRFGAQDGIIEDYGDAPGALAMTLLNASNEAQFTEAVVSVNGYHMRVPAGERVSLPAPTSGSKTYLVGALYDPALNVTVPTDQGGGVIVQMASEQGPVRLVAFDTTPDLSNGKRFLICYVLTRTSGPLTGATPEDRRRWIGPSIDWPWGKGSDSSPGNEGSYPRGTVRIDTTNHRVMHRGIGSDGTLRWLDVLDGGSGNLPLKSGIVARKTNTNPVEYDKYAGRVEIRGAVQRSSGNLSTGNPVPLAALPVGCRPSFGRRYMCRSSAGSVEVRVDSDGTVLMDDNGTTITYVDLSSISFKAEG